MYAEVDAVDEDGGDGEEEEGEDDEEAHKQALDEDIEARPPKVRKDRGRKRRAEQPVTKSDSAEKNKKKKEKAAPK